MIDKNKKKQNMTLAIGNNQLNNNNIGDFIIHQNGPSI